MDYFPPQTTETGRTLLALYNQSLRYGRERCSMELRGRRYALRATGGWIYITLWSKKALSNGEYIRLRAEADIPAHAIMEQGCEGGAYVYKFRWQHSSV